MGFLDLGKVQGVNSILEYINQLFNSDNFKIQAPFDKYYNPVAAKQFVNEREKFNAKAALSANQSKIEMFKLDEDSESNRMTFQMPNKSEDEPTQDEVDHLINSIKMKINQYGHLDENS